MESGQIHTRIVHSQEIGTEGSMCIVRGVDHDVWGKGDSEGEGDVERGQLYGLMNLPSELSLRSEINQTLRHMIDFCPAAALPVKVSKKLIQKHQRFRLRSVDHVWKQLTVPHYRVTAASDEIIIWYACAGTCMSQYLNHQATVWILGRLILVLMYIALSVLHSNLTTWTQMCCIHFL